MKNKGFSIFSKAIAGREKSQDQENDQAFHLKTSKAVGYFFYSTFLFRSKSFNLLWVVGLVSPHKHSLLKDYIFFAKWR